MQLATLASASQLVSASPAVASRQREDFRSSFRGPGEVVKSLSGSVETVPLLDCRWVGLGTPPPSGAILAGGGMDRPSPCPCGEQAGALLGVRGFCSPCPASHALCGFSEPCAQFPSSPCNASQTGARTQPRLPKPVSPLPGPICLLDRPLLPPPVLPPTLFQRTPRPTLPSTFQHRV